MVDKITIDEKTPHFSRITDIESYKIKLLEEIRDLLMIISGKP